MDTIADETLGNRTQMYALLARLFRKEVDDKLLVAMQAGIEVDGAGDAELNHGLSMMQDYLASPEASTLDLARDYAKALCGAGSTKRDAAYPYESVYTSKDGMLMQEARDGALAWYRRFGLSKAEDWNDCEDHLGLELEFVAYLCAECEKAQAAGDTARVAELLTAQRDFVREHLANWLPLFDRDADHKARTPFYRGLARVTSRYVQQDLEALDEMTSVSA